METKAKELFSIVDSLPLDLKINLVEKLLNSLNPSQSEVDEAWKLEVEKRAEEVKHKKVKLIPGEEVFKELKTKFKK